MIRPFALFAIYFLATLKVPFVHGRDQAIMVPSAIVNNVAASYGQGAIFIADLEGVTNGTISGLENVEPLAFIVDRLSDNPRRNLKYAFSIRNALAKFTLANPTIGSVNRMTYNIPRLDLELEGAIEISQNRICSFRLGALKIANFTIDKPKFSEKIETSEKERISSFKKKHVATILKSIRQDFESRALAFTIDRWTTCNVVRQYRPPYSHDYGAQRYNPNRNYYPGTVNYGQQAIDPRSLLTNEVPLTNRPTKQGLPKNINYNPQTTQSQNLQMNQQTSTRNPLKQGLPESDDQSQGDPPLSDQLQSDEPQSNQPQGKQSQGDPPLSDQLQSDEPQSNQPQGKQSEGDQPEGDQPEGEQSGGDQPEGERSGGDQPEGEHSEGDQSQGEQSEDNQPEGDNQPQNSQENKTSSTVG